MKKLMADYHSSKITRDNDSREPFNYGMHLDNLAMNIFTLFTRALTFARRAPMG